MTDKKIILPRFTKDVNDNIMFNNTDLQYMNEFIEYNLKDVPKDQINSYKKYHEEKMQKKEKKKEKKENEASTSQPVNTSNNSMNIPMVPTKKLVERKRKIFIDSKDRDKVKYPDASDFVISWGRSYNNVKQIRLVSLEFPNVVQTISSLVNSLSWINLEDQKLDDPFPVYNVLVSPGSYSLETLETEMSTQLKTLRRLDGQAQSDGSLPPRHLFIVETNAETDFVGFTSVIAKSAGINPISVTSGSPYVRFKQKDHGYREGERIHIIGAIGLIGGVNASTDINGAYNITVLDANNFQFEIKATPPTSNAQGGGTQAKTGREAPFQFMFGQDDKAIADYIGFPVENSSIPVNEVDPITSITVDITSIIPDGVYTKIVAPNHKLNSGDRIYLHNVFVTPDIYQNDRTRGTFDIFSVPSPDVIIIKYGIQHISDITKAFIGTQKFSMYYPGHNFNRITNIEQTDVNTVRITTLFDHGFDSLSTVRITGTNSVPSVDGYYSVIPVLNETDIFEIQGPIATPLVLTQSGYRGILTTDHLFYLYRTTAFGGFTHDELNNKPFVVRDIIDADNFTFTGRYGFSNRIETGGGSTIYINSKLHGFAGQQTNSLGGILYKPIALAGSNYVFLTCPSIVSDSISTSGTVKNIIAKLFITQNPGYVIFSAFDGTAVEFLQPIPKLDELRFQVRSPDNQIITFNGLDYSFGFELVEMVEE